MPCILFRWSLILERSFLTLSNQRASSSQAKPEAASQLRRSLSGFTGGDWGPETKSFSPFAEGFGQMRKAFT